MFKVTLLKLLKSVLKVMIEVRVCLKIFVQGCKFSNISVKTSFIKLDYDSLGKEDL